MSILHKLRGLWADLQRWRHRERVRNHIRTQTPEDYIAALKKSTQDWRERYLICLGKIAWLEKQIALLDQSEWPGDGQFPPAPKPAQCPHGNPKECCHGCYEDGGQQV